VTSTQILAISYPTNSSETQTGSSATIVRTGNLNHGLELEEPLFGHAHTDGLDPSHSSESGDELESNIRFGSDTGHSEGKYVAQFTTQAGLTIASQLTSHPINGINSLLRE
jgi:hypothetical protein